MWKMLILGLIVLLGVVPASFGQDGHPPCWASEMAQIEESANFYETTLSRLEGVETKEELLEFATAYLPKRQRDWVSSDRCAESIEFTWLSQRELNLGVAYKALDFGMRERLDYAPEVLAEYNPLGEALSDSYYPERFNQELARLRALAAGEEAAAAEIAYDQAGEIGGASTGSASSSEVRPRLPDCSVEALESLSIVLAQYHMYREHMTNFGTMAGLFDAIDPSVVWRDGLFAALPACREAFEAGWLMSRLADDYGALFGLTFAGYTLKVNPYHEEFQVNTQKLAELAERLPIDSGAHAVVWEYGGELDLCNIDEVALLTRILSEYLDLLDAGERISSLEELRAFADSLVVWRQEVWPLLPPCAEAFEIGLHLYRTAGDQILFDVPAIAESQLAKIIGAESTLSTRLGQIYSALPREWRSQHSGEIESHRRHCTAAERATIVDALAGFRTVLDSAVDFDEQPVLLSKANVYRAYVDERIAWRREFGVGLARCVIVFELDSVLALNLAESVSAHIPVLGAILSGSDLLQAIAAALAAGEDTVQATPDYANQMPLCSEAELRDLRQNYRAYSGIIEDVPDLDSRDALFDYIDAKLEWRAEVWTRLPICSEALQLGFLIHQIASDIATAAALAWHDLGTKENPYIALETQGRDALRLAVQRINGLIESGARRDNAPSADSPLPRCDEGELDDLAGYTYDRGLFVTIKERSIPILIEYIEGILSWRVETWAPLPACVESVILGGLVSRQKADFANFMALDWAGISFDENPFMPEIGNDASQMAKFVELLRKFNLEGIDQFVEAYWESGAR